MNLFTLDIPKCSAEFIIVHVWLRFPFTPFPGDLVGVSQLELAVRPLPRDDGGVGGVGQELKQELPQLDLTRALRHQTTACGREQGVRI